MTHQPHHSASRLDRDTHGSMGARILFLTPEMSDFVKTGGLGEVSGALPRALARHHDVRVLMPGYRQVVESCRPIAIRAHLPGVGDIPPCNLGYVETADGLGTYLLLSAELYDRDGTPYGTAAGDFTGADPDWIADLLHLNDWQSALAPAYCPWRGLRTPSVLTIHNLAYQGLFARELSGPLGVPGHAFHMDGVEFHGQLSFLKAGLYHASQITTVSQTYAREITTEQAGCGLDGLLRTRAAQGRLSGILNGIDEGWDPRTDPDLAIPFEVEDWKGKAANAEAVRTSFGLAVTRGPLFAIVSRLIHQKGIDLSLAAADTILAEGGQLVVIGQGEGRFEEALRGLAARHPGRIGLHVGFEEGTARRIFAGSDFLLMPSRFEPCGLAQMYAQAYGALPIVRRTGGLADTVENGATGFVFAAPTVGSYAGAIRRALDTFGQKKHLNAMRRGAMVKRSGWNGPAQSYAALYGRAIGNDAARRWKAA